MFSSRKKLVINERDPTFKVRYLGNVQTSMTKGEGCVDKPVSLLWNNYLSRPTPAIEMKLCISAAGLKVYTKEQGLTEYWAHRIPYCVAHPQFPKLFAWVYRHEGKKMKVELRCHAVLCASESKAHNIEVQLREKLQAALSEFMREKTRRQNSRITRSHSLGSAGGLQLPLRKKLLCPSQNFKPPIERSQSAPKLISIFEDFDGEETAVVNDPSIDIDAQSYKNRDDISVNIRSMDVLTEEDEEADDDGEAHISDAHVQLEQDPNADAISAINFVATAHSNTSDEHLEAVNNHDHTKFSANLDDISDHIMDLDLADSPLQNRRESNSTEVLTKHRLNSIDSDGTSTESGFCEQENKDACNGHLNGHIINGVKPDNHQNHDKNQDSQTTSTIKQNGVHINGQGASTFTETEDANH